MVQESWVQAAARSRSNDVTLGQSSGAAKGRKQLATITRGTIRRIVPIRALPSRQPMGTQQHNVIRGTKERGIDVSWRLVRAQREDRAVPLPGTVWINVGTSECVAGIVNFRQTMPDQLQPQGSAECLIRHRFTVLNHVLAGASDGTPLELTAVMNKEPKPDDWAALFLLDRTLTEGQLPQDAVALAEYMASYRRSTSRIVPRSHSAQAKEGTYLQLLEEAARNRTAPATLTLALACELLLYEPTSRERDTPDAPTGKLVECTDEQRFTHFKSLFEAALAACRKHREASLGNRTKRQPLEDFEMVGLQDWWTESVPDGLDRLRRFAEHAIELQQQCTPERFEVWADSTTRRVGKPLIVECVRRETKSVANSAEAWMEKLFLTSGLLRSGKSPPHATLTIHTHRHGHLNVHLEVDNLVDDDAERISRLVPKLARRLEFAEQQCRKNADVRRSRTVRYPDFPLMGDPWYDGRDHGYGFLASPKDGSALQAPELLRIIMEGPWLAAAHDQREGFGTRIFALTKTAWRDQHHAGEVRDSAFDHAAGSNDEGLLVRRYHSTPAPRPGTRRGKDIAPVWQAELHARSISALESVYPAPLDRSYTVCIVSRPQPPDPAARQDIEDLAEFCLGPGAHRSDLTDECMCWTSDHGVVILEIGTSERKADHWVGTVCDALALRHRLRQIKEGTSSDATAGEAQLESFYETLREWSPTRLREPAFRALLEVLDERLGSRSLRNHLDLYLRFSDERKRLQEEQGRQSNEEKLTAFLLVISALALVQIPLEMIQAYGVDKDDGSSAWKSVGLEWARWEIPGWVWPAAVVVLAALTMLIRRRGWRAW